MPACRACGAQAPDEARFCPTCGTTFGPALSTPVEGPAVLPPLPGAPAPPPLPPLPPATRPLGVLIMMLWNAAAGLLGIVVGIALLVAGPAMLSDPEVRPQVEAQLPPDFPVGYEALVAAMAAVGAVLLLMGFAMVAVAYGMHLGRGWAWTGMVALAVLWLLTSLLMFPGGLLGAALAAFLLWYFTRDGVKRWFGKQRVDEPGLPGYVPPPSRPPA